MNPDLSSLLTEGIYDRLGWKIRIGDGRSKISEWEDLVVGIHEAMHSDFDNSTATGLILIAYAYSVDQKKENKSYRDKLIYLAKSCSHVHELYATYTSINVLCQFNSDPDAPSPRELLTNFPSEYADFWGEINELATRFRSLFFARHFIITLLRVCMQGLAIRDFVVQGLSGFEVDKILPENLPPFRYPKLRQYAQNLDPDELFQSFLNQNPNIPCRARLIQDWNAPNDHFAQELITDELCDNLSDCLNAFLNEKFASKLKSQDGLIETLEYDGHMKFLDPLLEVVDAEIPIANASRKFKVSVGEEISEFTITSFQNEVLELSEWKQNASVYLFTSWAEEDWENLSSGRDTGAHHFLSAFPASVLLEQFSFDEDIQMQLAEAGQLPIPCLQRSVEVDIGIREIDMILFSHPESIKSFSTRRKDQLPIVSIVSMWAATNTKWQKEWLDPIKEASDFLLILLDIAPFAVFKQMASLKDFEAEYCLINLEVDGVFRTVFAMKSDHQNLPFPIIVPCTEMLARGINYFLTQNYPKKFRESTAFLKGNEMAKMYPMILGHLYREMRQFEFFTGDLDSPSRFGSLKS